MTTYNQSLTNTCPTLTSRNFSVEKFLPLVVLNSVLSSVKNVSKYVLNLVPVLNGFSVGKSISVMLKYISNVGGVNVNRVGKVVSNICTPVVELFLFNVLSVVLLATVSSVQVIISQLIGAIVYVSNTVIGLIPNVIWRSKGNIFYVSPVIVSFSLWKNFFRSFSVVSKTVSKRVVQVLKYLSSITPNNTTLQKLFSKVFAITSGTISIQKYVFKPVILSCGVLLSITKDVFKNINRQINTKLGMVRDLVKTLSSIISSSVVYGKFIKLKWLYVSNIPASLNKTAKITLFLKSAVIKVLQKTLSLSKVISKAVGSNNLINRVFGREISYTLITNNVFGKGISKAIVYVSTISLSYIKSITKNILTQTPVKAFFSKLLSLSMQVRASIRVIPSLSSMATIIKRYLLTLSTSSSISSSLSKNLMKNLSAIVGSVANILRSWGF